MDRPPLPPPLPEPTSLGIGLRLLALGIALAPLLVQTTTLVLSDSLRLTALVGALLALAIGIAGYVAQRRLAGTVGAVAGDSVWWLVVAVVFYNALAFGFACVAYVALFA